MVEADLRAADLRLSVHGTLLYSRCLPLFAIGLVRDVVEVRSRGRVLLRIAAHPRARVHVSAASRTHSTTRAATSEILPHFVLILRHSQLMASCTTTAAFVHGMVRASALRVHILLLLLLEMMLPLTALS